jgi:hypothetical protein
MKLPKPACEATKVHRHTGEWVPHSFADFLTELEALKHMSSDTGAPLLYRGHADREWRLDSTFVRTVKAKLLDMAPTDEFAEHVRQSGDLNAVLSSLLLLKFGSFAGPSAELLAAETEHGVDAWFELMKRFQQFPNEDMRELKGTNLVDWSRSSDIALYFANDRRKGAGALFVCDATATGKTLQVIPIVNILAKMREQVMGGVSNGRPLLFSPRKQIAYQRHKNQQAVYFAQMELRLDLLELWRLQEQEMAEEVIALKIVLPSGSQEECAAYLESKGIDETFIYPD